MDKNVSEKWMINPEWNLFVLGILTSVMLVACATFRTDFEDPSVTVSRLRILPSEGVMPQIEIGLHIVNPNRQPLRLEGMAYRLSIEGYNLLTGATSDLPVINGYDSGNVTLIATTDLFSSIRFLTSLMNTRREDVSYKLEAKLDPGGIAPVIRVRETGNISLSAPAQ